MDEPDVWVPFDSSAIEKAGYDPFTQKLWIVFKKSKKADGYLYVGFPKAKWQAFLLAPSKGVFYHQHVEGRYQATEYAKPK